MSGGVNEDLIAISKDIAKNKIADNNPYRVYDLIQAKIIINDLP